MVIHCHSRAITTRMRLATLVILLSSILFDVHSEIDVNQTTVDSTRNVASSTKLSKNKRSEEQESPVDKVFSAIPISDSESFTSCASGRSEDGATFTHKRCPRDVMAGVIYFCIYMVIPPDTKQRYEPVYDCVSADELPVECMEKREYYFPSMSLKVNGGNRTGALFCCLDDYCNESEEPPLSIVRLKREHDYQDTAHNAFPAVFVLTILFLCLGPQLMAFLEKRHISDRKRAERPKTLEVCKNEYFGTQEKQRKKEKPVAACFENGKKMNEVCKAMNKVHKYPLPDVTIEELPVSVHKEIYSFTQDSWEVKKCNRVGRTNKMSLAQRLIEHGPYHYNFDAAELGDLFDSTGTTISKEGTLLELTGDIWVIGNLDGAYADLFRWFRIINGWPPTKRVLFLGGIMGEDSQYSLETITMVFALKEACPDHVHILRGAIETEYLNIDGRFPLRISRALSEAIHKTCSQLPLAAIVGNKILCVHGGIPKQLASRDVIRDIRRPLVDVTKYSVAADLIFSCFGKSSTTIPGSRGHLLDAEGMSLHETCRRLNIDMIVRSRNPLPNGYKFLSRLVVSIWSAPGACLTTAGAIMHINLENVITIVKMSLNHKFLKSSQKERAETPVVKAKTEGEKK